MYTQPAEHIDASEMVSFRSSIAANMLAASSNSATLAIAPRVHTYIYIYIYI